MDNDNDDENLQLCISKNNAFKLDTKHFQLQCCNIKTPWSESASELYRQSGSRLSAKWLPTFADRGCHMVSVTDPYFCNIYIFYCTYNLENHHYFYTILLLTFNKLWNFFSSKLHLLPYEVWLPWSLLVSRKQPERESLFANLCLVQAKVQSCKEYKCKKGFIGKG
jgi:hypothetical protein